MLVLAMKFSRYAHASPAQRSGSAATRRDSQRRPHPR
jgi:hypothetical protein